MRHNLPGFTHSIASAVPLKHKSVSYTSTLDLHRPGKDIQYTVLPGFDFFVRSSLSKFRPGFIIAFHHVCQPSSRESLRIPLHLGQSRGLSRFIFVMCSFQTRCRPSDVAKRLALP